MTCWPQVGFWNLIGALGFELSPIFGYWAFPSGKYQRFGTSLSTYWGVCCLTCSGIACSPTCSNNCFARHYDVLLVLLPLHCEANRTTG